MSKYKPNTPVEPSAKPKTKNDDAIETNDADVLTKDTDMHKVDLTKTDMFEAKLKTIDVKEPETTDIEDMNGYTVSYPGVSNVKQTTDREGAWLEFDSLQDGQVRHMRVLNGKINK